MNRELTALLGREITENYISPFFHLNAKEDAEQITKRMQALKDIGIHAVTVEYTSGRPGFGLGLVPFDEAFMAVMDRLVSVCRALGMSFWLQDAAPFPTGQANGALELAENAPLNKQYIDERHIDVAGPRPGAVLHAPDLMQLLSSQAIMGGDTPQLASRERLCLVGCRRADDGSFDASTAVLLDDHVRDGLLCWDVPEGQWRVFCVFTTYDSGGRKGFMNLLSRASVQLQIDSVHVPIYEHLKDELGKTWSGFFYDEPELGNSKGFDFFALPGQRSRRRLDTMVLPWSGEMPAEMARRSERWREELPFLWYDAKDAHAGIRYRYMDSVTRLVEQNYSLQMHEWCRARGVGYIGHVLEDENSHGRLGCGTGHFFRVQRGQDKAGIDLISGQLMPGQDRYVTWYGEANGDGEFYHYGLAKLASSAAHIDPGKNHQSVCELLALYGAVCGPLLRKFVVDHLLVNGVNNMIYADPHGIGIPPRFHRVLNDYTNRMCALLTRLRPVTKVALLYHAEAEWSGDCQLFQVPAGELARHQLSYDVIPDDVFSDRAYYQTETHDGLRINANLYEALVIPRSKYLPEATAAFVAEAQKTGFPVIFVDAAPTAICGTLDPFAPEAPVTVVPLTELAQAVAAAIRPDIQLESPLPWLRYAHFEGQAGTYFLLHNEAPLEAASVRARLALTAPVYRLDVLAGCAYALPTRPSGDGYVELELELERFESALLYSGAQAPPQLQPDTQRSWTSPALSWRITLGDDAEPLPDKALGNINAAERRPDFAGRIRYAAALRLDAALPDRLDLGEVHESCELFVNGRSAGCKIAPPYVFDVAGLLRPGENELLVEVYNNAGHGERVSAENFMSMFSTTMYGVYGTGGLLGPVRLGASPASAE